MYLKSATTTRAPVRVISVFRGKLSKIAPVILFLATILWMLYPTSGVMAATDKHSPVAPFISAKPRVLVLHSYHSGYSLNGQAAKILDRGCNGFIQKPFSMKAISQKVREILDK